MTTWYLRGALRRFAAPCVSLAFVTLLALPSFAQAPGDVLWQFRAEHGIATTPTLTTGGLILFGADDGKLYALNPDGTLRWSFQTGAEIRSSPLASPGGVIYFGSEDRRIYALSMDGELQWSFTGNGAFTAAPALGTDGSILAVTAAGQLYALSPEGVLRWNRQTGATFRCAPAVAGDGTIYIGGNDRVLRSLTQDGGPRWQYESSANISTVVLNGDFEPIMTSGQKLIALSAAGEWKWEFAANNLGTGLPVIGGDGTIYLGAMDGWFYALRNDGTLKWQFQAQDSLWGSAAIAADGTIYFGSDDRKLYALSSTGEHLWSFTAGSTPGGSPVIGPDGTVYFGAMDQYLYAIVGGSPSASAPWPTFGRDPLHTGNSGLALPPIVQLRFPRGGGQFAYGSQIPLEAEAIGWSNQVSRVDFLSNTSVVGTVMARPFRYDWTNATPGITKISAVAMDDGGLSSRSAPTQIEVFTRLSVQLTAPLDNTTFPRPVTVVMQAQAEALDASIDAVDFFEGANPIGRAVSAPYEAGWTNPPAGRWTIRARVTDAIGGSKLSDPVSFDVIAENSILARDDSYEVTEDTLLVVASSGVLANDSFNVTGTPVAERLDPPAQGVVNLDPDGGFQYMPVTNFFGLDTFTYQVIVPGVTSLPAVVRITVLPVNDPPVVQDLSVATDEDRTLTFQLRAEDPDDDPLQFSIVTPPTKGWLFPRNPSASSVDVEYRPFPDVHGEDHFTWIASDGVAESAPATATIAIRPIEDIPLARPDEWLARAGSALEIPAERGVLANDYDGDGEALTALIETQAQNGTVDLQPDGSFHYTPATGFTGLDSFSYRARAGTRTSEPAQVQLRVGYERWAEGFEGSAVGSAVHALQPMPGAPGKVFAAGQFSGWPLDYRTRGVALWNGARWETLGTGPFNGVNGFVRALAWFDGALHAGGEFWEAGGRTALNFARWDGHQWHAAGGGLNQAVLALAVSETDLYAGGNFTVTGGQPARGVARWDGTNWFAMGAGLEGSVEALVLDPQQNLYGAANVGEGLDSVGRVLRWDGVGWTPVGEAFEGRVRALAFHGDNLVAAGHFSNAGSAGATNIARWNGATWTAMDLGVPGEAGALAAHGEKLYAGLINGFEGWFSPVQILEWDGQKWEALPQELRAERYSSIRALAIIGQELYAGGQFTRAGDGAVDHLARWDGTNWHGLTRAFSGGNVLAIQTTGDNVFAAGTFAAVAGVPVRRVAGWDGANWFPLEAGETNGVGGRVNALAVRAETELFAGGEFQEAGGKQAHNVARWDGTAWHTLGAGIEGRVHALALDDPAGLFAGGDFQSAGGVVARNFAFWNGATWNEPGGGVFGRVYALARSGQGIVVAGDFLRVGELNANRIAIWDGSGWHALGEGIGSGAIHTVAVRGTEIFVGGRFTMAGGELAEHLAHWDGQRWHPLATSVTRAGSIASVQSLSVSGRSLFAGGLFHWIDGVAFSAIAQWDGTAWLRLGSGVEGDEERVSALAARGGELFAGGSFSMAGGRSSRQFGVWSLPNSPPEVEIVQPQSGSLFFTGDDVTVEAAAMDRDGTIQRVDFHGNGSLLGSATAAPFRVVWPDVFAGDYDIVAVAEDDQGERSTSASVRIAVRPPADNQPPVVSLTRPAAGTAIALGESVEIAAEASDPDGTIREVRFSMDGQLLEVVREPPFTIMWASEETGMFSLTAEAQDNLGSTAVSLPVQVRVHRPPEVYISSPSEGDAYGLPVTVNLVADARDDGEIARVDFLMNGVFFATAEVFSSPNAYFWWEDPPPGDYAISAIAYDTDGASTLSLPVNFSVLPPNQPPEITLLSPADGSHFGVPTNIVMRVQAEDSDGFVREVQFFDGGMQLGRLTTEPYVFVVRNLSPGAYDLRARAMDDRGAETWSSMARITATNDPARVPKYELVDLGTLGGDGSYAYGVNNNNDVVGQAMRQDRSERAFLFRDGEMIDLGTFSGSGYSQAVHVNNLGWIIGTSYDSQSGEDRPFLIKGTNMAALQTIGGRYNVPFRINDKGQIAGAFSDRDDRFRAVIFNDGVPHQITTDGRESHAYGLNNLGAMAGKIEGFDGIIRAFRYDPTNGVRSLDGFVEDYSEARGINDAGNIAGKLSGSTGWEAFLWSDGYVVELGSLGGGMSEAYALNNHNQVVGRSLTRQSHMTAFLWHGAVMHDLNALIAPDPRWRLTMALDINDHGTVVGEGEWTSPANETQRRAYMLRLASDSPVRPEDNRFLKVIDGEFSAIVPVLRGQALLIEATSDFVDWLPVSTNYNRSGVVDFSDPGSRGAARRFYRILPFTQ